jgi:hypothetical protein
MSATLFRWLALSPAQLSGPVLDRASCAIVLGLYMEDGTYRVMPRTVCAIHTIRTNTQERWAGCRLIELLVGLEGEEASSFSYASAEVQVLLAGQGDAADVVLDTRHSIHVRQVEGDACVNVTLLASNADEASPCTYLGEGTLHRSDDDLVVYSGPIISPSFTVPLIPPARHGTILTWTGSRMRSIMQT